MMHISASTAPIRAKQKPLYSKLNAESDKYYYNSLCKSLENPPESLHQGGVVKTASGCDVGSVCWNETLTLIAVNQATAMSKGLESSMLKSKNHATILFAKYTYICFYGLHSSHKSLYSLRMLTFCY